MAFIAYSVGNEEDFGYLAQLDYYNSDSVASLESVSQFPLII